MAATALLLLIGCDTFSSADAGQEFNVSGVVQAIEGERWTVSGAQVTVDSDTEVESTVAVGDVIEAQGWIQEDGRWRAQEIQPEAEDQPYFSFTGTVQSTNPWIISDVTLQTREWTAIDAGIEVGDEVHARGPILDGVWVAGSIDRVDEEPGAVALEWVGTVYSVDPWVVNGILLMVDEDTAIRGDIGVGSIAKARAMRQADGGWLAEEITLYAAGDAGCVISASVVTSRDGDAVTLQDGTAFDLDAVESVEGDIQVGNTVLLVRCPGENGDVVFRLVKVLGGPSDAAVPTISPTTSPTASPTAAQGAVTLSNCVSIAFLGATENTDGTSTWRYTVEELPCAQDLSHWVLELPACADIVDAAPDTWEEVHPDPNIPLTGIKWEVDDGFQNGTFAVVLTGDLAQGTVRVGAKGPDVATATIPGPICAAPTITPSPTTATVPTVTPSSTPLPPTPSSTPVPPTQVPTATDVPAPPGPSGPIVITENNDALSFTCNGNPVIVRGNHNTITLLGTCSSLTISGNTNRVVVENVSTIHVSGNKNEVFWQTGSPAVTDTGNNNTIRPS